MQSKFEAEINEVSSTLTDSCSQEKQDLLDNLTKRNADNIKKVTDELTNQCQIDKADFKQ